MPERHITEFGINMINGYTYLAQQDKFDHIDENIKDTLNIYFICRRARVACDVKSFTCDDKYVKGVVLFREGEQTHRVPFITRNMMGTSDVCFESEFPHNIITAYNSKTGERISNTNVSLLVSSYSKIPRECRKLCDLEVLYIGQAYNEGSRNAVDRLNSHSRLQEIYSDNQKCPDKEIWIVMFSFEEMRIMSMDPRVSSDPQVRRDDYDRFMRTITHPITEGQKINFTEAALIRSFKPKYNKMFKDNFPDVNHSTYEACYKLDLNAISVEVDTEAINACLYSDCVQPAEHHLFPYQLHSLEERKSMFDFNW